MSINDVIRRTSKMEDYFLIPQQHIENNWKPVDLNYEFFCLEYCEEVLDIPLIYIENTLYDKDGLSIELKNINNSILDEDWYIQLQRLAKYARAS